VTECPRRSRATSELVSGSVQPRFTGNEVVGAVDGALFLDLARRLGLREAAGLYLDSVNDMASRRLPANPDPVVRSREPS
jgi:hypothetical protein